MGKLTIEEFFEKLRAGGAEISIHAVDGYVTVRNAEDLKYFLSDKTGYLANVHGITRLAMEAFLKWDGTCTGTRKNGKPCAAANLPGLYTSPNKFVQGVTDRCFWHKEPTL